MQPLGTRAPDEQSSRQDLEQGALARDGLWTWSVQPPVPKSVHPAARQSTDRVLSSDNGFPQRFGDQFEYAREIVELVLSFGGRSISEGIPNEEQLGALHR